MLSYKVNNTLRTDRFFFFFFFFTLANSLILILNNVLLSFDDMQMKSTICVLCKLQYTLLRHWNFGKFTTRKFTRIWTYISSVKNGVSILWSSSIDF